MMVLSRSTADPIGPPFGSDYHSPRHYLVFLPLGHFSYILSSDSLNLYDNGDAGRVHRHKAASDAAANLGQWQLKEENHSGNAKGPGLFAFQAGGIRCSSSRHRFGANPKPHYTKDRGHRT